MKKRWTQLPLRSCTSRYKCALSKLVGQCDGTITFGQPFRDGGRGRRAHERCVRAAATDAQSDALAEIGSALAAGIFGLKPDRTTGVAN